MSSGMSSRNGGGSGCRLLLVHLPLPLTAQSCLLKYEELYVGSFPLSLQVRCGLWLVGIPDGWVLVGIPDGWELPSEPSGALWGYTVSTAASPQSA